MKAEIGIITAVFALLSITKDVREIFIQANTMCSLLWIFRALAGIQGACLMIAWFYSFKKKKYMGETNHNGQSPITG